MSRSVHTARTPRRRRPPHKYIFCVMEAFTDLAFRASCGEPAPPLVQHTPAGERIGQAPGLHSRGRSTHPAHVPAHFVGCCGRAAAWFGRCGHTAAKLALRRVREGARGTVCIIDSALVQQKCPRNSCCGEILSSCSAGRFLSEGGLQQIFKAKLDFAAQLAMFSLPVCRLEL